MASCYKTSDNRYFNCAPIMQDGRQFTDYRPSCYLNSLLASNNNTQSSYEYRMFLQRNGNKVMGMMKDYNKRMSDCDVCQNTMLDEQSTLTCGPNGCNKTINNINGLGMGRDNGPIDRVWKKEIPSNNPQNCCRPQGELFNYYHTMDYNLRNDSRLSTPSGGSVFYDTDYSQCL
tara:strand:- start:655 stop:1176 length:522 start_codon:yes stop_codon:yes gene_type:complete